MTVTIKKRKFNIRKDSADIKQTTDDYGQKYSCDVCEKDITHLVIVRCATCSDYDVCVDCFREGKESGDHKNSHPYRVIHALDFPIFEADWGADEEVLLTEGLESFGMGNWDQISELIVTKNKIECKEHYQRVYVDSADFPKPDLNVAFGEENEILHARGPGFEIKLLPKWPRAPASAPVNHDIQGYMPGRNEFEIEFENEAEQMVKDIEFNENDLPQEVVLKLAMLNVYNRILTERVERKRFIMDQGLVPDFRKVMNTEKRRSKEERDVYHKMRVFAKMQSREDFELFMTGIALEVKTRSRIAKLQNYRAMGITTIADANEYEKERAARVFYIFIQITAKLSGANYDKSLRRESPNYKHTNLEYSENIVGIPESTPHQTRILNSPSFDLLMDAEQAICISLTIYPVAYIRIKDSLIKECSKGSLRSRQIKQIINIADASKSDRLIQFFSKMGWIF